jgi:two-component system, NtrC family, response regulator AtoC
MSQAILLIEDETILAKNIAVYLERGGYEVRIAESAEAGLALMEEFRPDAVVLDFNLPGLDGLQALTRIHALDAAVRVVMITGHGNVELAVQAMKAGAFDFISKPVSLSKLRLVIEKAFGDTRRDTTLAYYQRRDAENAAGGGLLGESPPMRALKLKLQQLLRAEAQMRDGDPPAVLVLGETGAGKEVVARALHYNGPRRDKPFVELNCAALPAQLLESELFGHERGAFTDARERKLGLVETAEGGTLFLDEIGDMDLALQTKLLKLLEEKTVRRIGSVREQKVNVRIVAATHRPLEKLVEERRFRADLYYRLRVVQLVLPPLRERGADILLLTQHFLQHHAQRYGMPTPALAESAAKALLQHPWPGNVRELRNVLEQAVLLHPGAMVEAEHLALSPPRGRAAVSPADAAPTAVAEGSLPEIERRALLQALESNAWNVSRAARVLGISRDTLRYRMEKFDLGAEAP